MELAAYEIALPQVKLAASWRLFGLLCGSAHYFLEFAPQAAQTVLYSCHPFFII
jgi:hypothetical protein